jgi:hypothetical protein
MPELDVTHADRFHSGDLAFQEIIMSRSGRAPRNKIGFLEGRFGITSVQATMRE